MADRPTPPGTWPLLISGALLLLITPAFLLQQVVPDALAIVGAVIFTLVAFAAVVWSFVVFLDQRGRPGRGVPIAGLIVGVIVVVTAALALVPLALA